MAEYSEARTAPAAHQRHCVLVASLTDAGGAKWKSLLLAGVHVVYTTSVSKRKSYGMYIGELAGRTTNRPANQAPHSSSHCVHQTREPARPTTAGWVLVKGVAALATQENENAIFRLLTRYSPSNMQSIEKHGENRLALGIIVLILLLDYLLFSRCRRISIERKEKKERDTERAKERNRERYRSKRSLMTFRMCADDRERSKKYRLMRFNDAYVFKRQVSFC